MNRRSLILTSAALTSVATVGVLLAGPLQPPAGPITSTYKPLTDVEPRIAINAANTPGDGNSSFRIAQPGSYYLAGNLSVGTGSGIEIAASNVTIDLNGFALTGSLISADGITTDGLRDNIAIRNGTIANWGSDGINLATGGVGSGALIESVTVASNGAFGIRAGNRVVLRGCIARSNASDGFNLSSRAVVTDCVASQNGSRGFAVGAGSTLTGCTATDNASDGFSLPSSTTVMHCTSSLNTGRGFFLGTGCTINGCTASSNGDHGIALSTRCMAMNNNSISNTNGGNTAAGIYVSGDINHVESNHCSANNVGIHVASGANSVVAPNTCGQSSPGTIEIKVSFPGAQAVLYRNIAEQHFLAPSPYDVNPSGVAPIVDVSDGQWLLGSPNTNHPWANFAH